MARLMSFAKTVRQFQDRTKTVTRRDGWPDLQPGDIVEGVEWNPRVGRRWACGVGQTGCGWVGPMWWSSNPEGVCPECGAAAEYRKPLRLGLAEIVSARREPLGDITADDARREGFPGLTLAEFIALYCAPRLPDPERVVTRIEFSYVEED